VVILAVASMLSGIAWLCAIGLHGRMRLDEVRGVTLSRRDKRVALIALGFFPFGMVLLFVAIARDPMSVSTR
jgi:Mn2+/Fe2+ NRAMP family transporter